ncbi:MAG: TetR/AcrR family transcriptional regulator [Clostridiales bacterium]|nr:TetR/AcrR family transcriptional regulator [Clostridiales bacterium]
MPKNTFIRLPEEKKTRIFDAAVKEFSVRRFSEASLNQIMKTAEIPWGSYYQYFVDKADLFEYVIGRIGAELQALEEKKAGDFDALTMFANKLSSTIELNKAKPEYVSITLVQYTETDPAVKKFFELQGDHKQMVIQLFERDKARGLIRQDVDSEAVIDMVYLLSRETFVSCGADPDAYLTRMESYLKIIRAGIENPRASAD